MAPIRENRHPGRWASDGNPEESASPPHIIERTGIMGWTYEARVAMGLISGKGERQHHNGNVRAESDESTKHSADKTVQPHLDAVRALRPSSHEGKHRSSTD